jgi:recombination protein RecA
VGELLDMGVEHGVVDKSGAWFAYGSERLGQGKENVRAFLLENNEIAQAIEKDLLIHLGVLEPEKPEEKQAERDSN